MQSEALAQEFARLVKEYHEGDDYTKPEAWNLLADYAVDNADAISAALSDKQAGEVKTDRGDLLSLIKWAHETLYEINPSNYDHDEVCKLNDASVEVILGLARALGEKHGYSADWWEKYRTDHPLPALVYVPAVDPVAKQWCAYEDGHQHTSWYPDGYGDRAGWEALAKRNPTKYQVATRALYTSPPLSREGEDAAEAFARIVAARKSHIDATDTYNTRLALVNCERAKGNWSMKVDQEARAMWDAQSAFIRTAQDEADAALAATRSASATIAKGCAE